MRKGVQGNASAGSQPIFAGGKTIDLFPKEIVYCAATKKIYASMPSSGPTRGNTITIISLETGAILKSVYIGSDPGVLAISDPPKYLYVALGGASTVRRFDLTTETAGLQF